MRASDSAPVGHKFCHRLSTNDDWLIAEATRCYATIMRPYTTITSRYHHAPPLHVPVFVFVNAAAVESGLYAVPGGLHAIGVVRIVLELDAVEELLAKSVADVSAEDVAERARRDLEQHDRHDQRQIRHQQALAREPRAAAPAEADGNHEHAGHDGQVVRTEHMVRRQDARVRFVRDVQPDADAQDAQAQHLNEHAIDVRWLDE